MCLGTKFISKLFFFSIIIVLSSCVSKQEKKANNNSVFLIDMEEEIEGHNLYSKDFYKGKKSLKIEGDEKFTHKINDVKQGDRFSVSAWVKGKGYLTILEEDGTEQKAFPSITVERGWRYMEYTFKVDNPGLFAFSLNSEGNETALFDDLKIEYLKRSLPQEDKEDIAFNLVISDKNLKKLEKKRNKAIEKGILVSEKGDWVSATIELKEDIIPVKVRLKGDWTDHLEGDKWSYRVKVKGDKYVLGMKEFSFQTTEVRGDLSEWIFHQLLEEEDILNTTYQFCLLKVNGEMKGVYALEEHFTKLLVESRNRREGPIVKFSEEHLWNARVKNGGKDNHNVKNYFSAEVVPFGKKKIAESVVLNGQFDIAKNLLHQYKYGLKELHEVFDIDRLAKYMAIMDITKSYHGWVWHNQRWYYNGITCLLEPIGYDGFYAQPGVYWKDKPCAGCLSEENKRLFSDAGFGKFTFSDSIFRSRYFYYLEEHFSGQYMEDFLTKIEPELKKNTQLLQKEYKDYHYDESILLQNVNNIQMWLKGKNHIQAYNNQYVYPKTSFQTSNKEFLPDNELSTVAYKNSSGDYTLFNNHQFPITIMGLGDNPADISEITPTKVEAFLEKNQPQKVEIATSKKGKYFFYKVDYSDSIFQTRIIDSPSPTDFSPAQQFSEKGGGMNIFSRDGETLILQGKHEIKHDVIIPSGFVVKIEEGTEVNLTNQSKFISYSPVIAKGTKEAPIKVQSTDGTANGFTILLAEEESELNYVDFDNLNTLNYKGWVLTGAVSFYESDVVIKNCSFSNNNSEDALNIIRSTFNVQNSVFENTYSDAFDGDFCVGIVNNSSFKKIGNDAIDFSGSKITVTNCTMNQVSDKGISIGENSTVTAKKVFVSGAALGISAKDLSVGNIDSLVLEDCKYGFAIYQKKAQFGPGTATATNVEFENVEQQFILDLASKITLNQKTTIGDQKIDIDSLFY